MTEDDKTPIAMSIDDVKREAAAVAREMKNAAAAGVAAPLRMRFINVRAALFQRGIYDPVLVRFDSATVSHASVTEIADQLEKVAANL